MYVSYLCIIKRNTVVLMNYIRSGEYNMGTWLFTFNNYTIIILRITLLYRELIELIIFAKKTITELHPTYGLITSSNTKWNGVNVIGRICVFTFDDLHDNIFFLTLLYQSIICGALFNARGRYIIFIYNSYQ